MRRLLLCSVVIALGCGAGPQSTISKKSRFADEFEDAPQWVISKACTSPPVDNPEKVICGVGSHQIKAAHLMNLAHRSALAKASAQVALFLKGRVETLERTYAGEYAQGVEDIGADADSKSVEITERWAKMNLPGVKSVATWISPSDNYYVLATVDVEGAIAAAKKFQGLSERQRKIIDGHEKDLLDALKSKPE